MKLDRLRGLKLTVKGWYLVDHGIYVQSLREAIMIRDENNPRPKKKNVGRTRTDPSLPEFMYDSKKCSHIMVRLYGKQKTFKYGKCRTRDEAIRLADQALKEILQDGPRGERDPGKKLL